MSLTVAVMRNVGWNTAATFGVALASGAVTYAVSQYSHYLFEAKQDIKVTSSAVIRQVAFAAGIAAGFYALQRTTVVNIAFDQPFATAHSLSVMFGLYSMAIAYLISFGPIKTGTLLYASVGTLTLAAPFVAHFGKNAIIPAIGIGAVVGSYL